MTRLLEVHPGDRVLEIGSGSGYQAAVLAALVVCTGNSFGQDYMIYRIMKPKTIMIIM